MKSTGFKDIDNKEIFVGMKYYDVENMVSGIEVIEIDGIFYAQPDGLDAELLEDVGCGLKIVNE